MHEQMKTWVPESALLRWFHPTGRLQQTWVCQETGEREWRDVPWVVAADDHPLLPVQPMSAFIKQLQQK
jgi:hypothetical protein